jgi:DNA-binding SARP family transcriptional activator
VISVGRDPQTAPDFGFLVLGPFEVRLGGEAVELRSARQRALLMDLVLHLNEVVTNDRLIEDVWPEDKPSDAKNVVQVHVSQLRKLLEPHRPRPSTLLVTRSGGYMLCLDPARVDSVRFEGLVNEGLAALAIDEPLRALTTLDRALALWRGPALADFAFDGFAREEIARLEELRLLAVEERIEAALALGRHASVVPELEKLAAANPLRERLAGQLMLALYRSGRQAEALEAYATTRRRLVDEMGIEPGPPLQRLEREILNQDAALDLPEAAGAAPARPAHEPPEPPPAPEPTPAPATRKTVTFLFADFVLEPARGGAVDP